MNKIYIEKLNSTNDYIKENFSKFVNEFTTVYCNEQSKGRGQRSNTWHSSNGKNLTFSFILYPNFRIEEIFYLNIVISLGIFKTLNKYHGNVTIKWPNDIYINKNKICGILIENFFRDEKINKSIVGIGINVNEKEFPKNIVNPTSLFLENNRDYDLEVLLDEVLYKIKDIYTDFYNNESEYKKEYIENLFLFGEKTRFRDKNGVFNGVIKDVLNSGKLVVDNLDTQKSNLYLFKEIEYILD